MAVWIEVNPRSRVPIYVQIAEQVRHAAPGLDAAPAPALPLARITLTTPRSRIARARSRREVPSQASRSRDTHTDRNTLGEGPREVVTWMARSLGLAESGEAPAPADLLARFDTKRLPLEPMV